MPEKALIIFTGCTLDQTDFWKEFLEKTEVLSFDKSVARVAVEVDRNLNVKESLLIQQIFIIAVTAIAHGLPLTIFNRKHFERVENLIVQD